MKTNTLITNIELQRSLLVSLAEKHQFDFQHPEVLALSKKLDTFIHLYMSTQASA